MGKTERFTVYLQGKLAKAIWRAIPKGIKGTWLSNILLQEYTLGHLDNLIPIEKRVQIRRIWIESQRKVMHQEKIKSEEQLVVKEPSEKSVPYFCSQKRYGTYTTQKANQDPVQVQEAKKKAEMIVKKLDAVVENTLKKLHGKVEPK